MATHSSVLAWRIPGTGEPGGLPSMGSHRVGHNWSNLAAVAAARINIHFCSRAIGRMPDLWWGGVWDSGLNLGSRWHHLSCFPELHAQASSTRSLGWGLATGMFHIPSMTAAFCPSWGPLVNVFVVHRMASINMHTWKQRHTEGVRNIKKSFTSLP